MLLIFSIFFKSIPSDTSIVTKLFENIFKFEQPNGLKYGQMIIPFVPANFGPMYFSKMTRT